MVEPSADGGNAAGEGGIGEDGVEGVANGKDDELEGEGIGLTVLIDLGGTLDGEASDCLPSSRVIGVPGSRPIPEARTKGRRGPPLEVGEVDDGVVVGKAVDVEPDAAGGAATEDVGVRGVDVVEAAFDGRRGGVEVGGQEADCFRKLEERTKG